jgi:hypothetical protein
MKTKIFFILLCICFQITGFSLFAQTAEFPKIATDNNKNDNIRNSLQFAASISVGNASFGRPALMYSVEHTHQFTSIFALETGLHFSSWSSFLDILQPTNVGIQAWLSNQFIMDIAGTWYPIASVPIQVSIGPAFRWHSAILTTSKAASLISQGLSIGAVVKVEYDCGTIMGTFATWGIRTQLHGFAVPTLFVFPENLPQAGPLGMNAALGTYIHVPF